MCGIAGINWHSRDIIDQMVLVMSHRGPDDNGTYLDEGVSLGHVRLSILDLSERGHQPMSFDSLHLTYNGEIYNYKDVRNELIECGYEFNSDTDTEVILKAYHKWGGDCVKRFNGMWAFCIYDTKKNILFLSRDRFGIKPLYYYFDGDHFAFGSDLNVVRQAAVVKELDIRGVNNYFYQKYIGSDSCIFKNYFKLKPSENLEFDLQAKSITSRKYFDLSEEVNRYKNISIDYRLAEIESILYDSVNVRMISDVPIGAFLSGGIDSSLISSIIKKNREELSTFSIGFEEESFDETCYSKQVSEYLGVDHQIDRLDMSYDLIENIIKHMDEPLADSSVVPTCLLSEAARKRVTVCLSGDGADEVFGGYDTHLGYFVAKYFPGIVRKPLNKVMSLIPVSDKKVSLSFKIKRYLRDFDSAPVARHLNWMATYNDNCREELLGQAFIPVSDLNYNLSGDSFEDVQLNDINNYLSGDILKKVDFASMRSSLEVRVPFLDYRLVPLVLSLPEKYKVRYFETKYLLKKMACEQLPRNIVYRKKRGFSVPVSRWMRDGELFSEYLLDRNNYVSSFIDYDYVKTLYEQHKNRQSDNSRQLWLVFVFNYWLANL